MAPRLLSLVLTHRLLLRLQLEQIQAQTSELNKQKSELAQLGAGELVKVSQQLFEEKAKNENTLAIVAQLESVVAAGRQEMETLR